MTHSNRTLSCPLVNHAHSVARFSVAVATITAAVVLPAVPAQASTLDVCAHGCAYTALAPGVRRVCALTATRVRERVE